MSIWPKYVKFICEALRWIGAAVTVASMVILGFIAYDYASGGSNYPAYAVSVGLISILGGLLLWKGGSLVVRTMREGSDAKSSQST